VAIAWQNNGYHQQLPGFGLGNGMSTPTARPQIYVR
jgi:hypothetical protein